MKIGELYDMARSYLPDINPTLFTHFYNIGLSKLTNEIRLVRETDTYTDSTYQDALSDTVKILEVRIDGEVCPRYIGGGYNV
jgi:hypothetical protein